MGFWSAFLHTSHIKQAILKVTSWVPQPWVFYHFTLAFSFWPRNPDTSWLCIMSLNTNNWQDIILLVNFCFSSCALGPNQKIITWNTVLKWFTHSFLAISLRISSPPLNRLVYFKVTFWTECKVKFVSVSHLNISGFPESFIVLYSMSTFQLLCWESFGCRCGKSSWSLFCSYLVYVFVFMPIPCSVTTLAL